MEVWSKRVSAARQKKLVFANHVDRSPEEELKPGQIYRRQRVSHLAARSKSANTAISYETVKGYLRRLLGRFEAVAV